MKFMRIQETIGYDFKIIEGVATAEAPNFLPLSKPVVQEARSKKIAAAAPAPVDPDGGEDGNILRIVTVVEAIHSGLTRNLTFYSADNLEKSISSWTDPYNKPVIVNHDTDEEPLGRVIKATYKKSVLAPDVSTVELELEITDPDTIELIMDGRYLTLSIGGSASTVTCSICGKDLVQDGYCGHMKGKTYEGKQAYWIIGEMKFDEISFVNVPADGYAQIVQKDIAPENKGKPQQAASKEGVKKVKVKKPVPVTVTESVEDILDQIDANRVTEEENEAPEPNEEEEQETETPEQEEEEAEETDPEIEEDPEEDPEEPEEAMRKSKDRIVVLENENTTLLAERDTAQSALAIAQQELTTSQANLQSAEDEAKTLRTQNITLASYAHTLLVEGVINVSLALGEVAEAGKEELKAALVKESSRALRDKMTNLVAESASAPRVIARINNPGLVLTDKQQLNENGELEESTKPEDKKELTHEEFAEKLVNALNRQRK